ncbi:hypothetical protein MKX03_034713 [Papaver bracteatum]|nr:hypothetical protein MKX03_034713 [Papaver bracteatum]
MENQNWRREDREEYPNWLGGNHPVSKLRGNRGSFISSSEVEFRSVLYIPGMAPLNNEHVFNEKTKNIRLCVKECSSRMILMVIWL